MIILGQEVKDKVTGLVGIATAKVEYLNGCVQFGVKQKVKKDGKMPEIEYIDIGQLEVVGKGILVEKDIKSPGGDMQDCPKI